MADKKAPLELTCIKTGKISNGQGGYYREGTKFQAVDQESARQLKARGLAK